MLADQLDYVVGVDPHRDTHALAVVHVLSGAVVFEAAIAASGRGYAEALRLVDARAPGRRAFAVVDAAVRRFAPLRLGRVGRAGAAQALRALPPVRDAGSAVTALLAVRRHAPELRPLLWLLERARDGELAPHHLGSAVMLLRPVGDAAAWAQLVALLRLLLAIDRPASVDRRP